jgi:hypothetical protein
MAPEIFHCPECNTALRRPPSLNAGDAVRCPKCRVEFEVPETDAAPPPPAAPSPMAPSEEKYSGAPGSARPRFSDVEDDFNVTTKRRPVRSEADWDEDEDQDYPRSSGDHDPAGLACEWHVDLGRWFSYGSAHWGAVLGPAIGFGVLYLVINAAISCIPFVSWLVQIMVVPPLAAGLTIVCLAQLKGKSWTFGDFFSGFQWWGPLVALNLLTSLAAGVLVAPVVVLALVAGNAAGGGSDPALIFILLGIGVVMLCVLAFLSVRAMFFAIPLIIDRGYGPIEAIHGSWVLTRGHFWGLFGLSLLLGLINIALVTIPLTQLVATAGYLLIAGTRRPIPLPGDEEDY